MYEQEMALKNLIYKIRTGSQMYGTNIETSDEDFAGIFIPDKEYVIGLKNVDQVEMQNKISKGIRNSTGDTDYTIYSLPKFISLAIGNNPNIIEFFYTPTNAVLHINKYGEKLISNRDLFLSKKLYHTFKGYSYAQRRKFEVKQENNTGRVELVAKYGYDTKTASHMIRLLVECEQLLVEKNLTLPLNQNNYIRDIKLGKFTLESVLQRAAELEKIIDYAYIKSALQYSANKEAINKLQMELLEEFWSEK